MSGAGRIFAEGDRVLLVDRKDRRYLVALQAGHEFHSHAGFLAHDDIIGAADGAVRCITAACYTYTVLAPTLAEFVLKMKRGAQVIYPKDLGPIPLPPTSSRALGSSRASAPVPCR
ncbi:MAG: hypothetical protein R2699_06850 [Acidimicrobiales bacterium]